MLFTWERFLNYLQESRNPSNLFASVQKKTVVHLRKTDNTCTGLVERMSIVLLIASSKFKKRQV